MSQRTAGPRKAVKVPNGAAVPSPIAGPSKLPSRPSKRAVDAGPEDEDDDDELGLNGDALDLLDGDDSVEEEEESEEEVETVDEDDEPFPELDSSSDLNDEDEDEDAGRPPLNGTRARLADEDGDSDDPDFEDVEDEEDGSESGYNSSDIDAIYSSSTSISSKASSSRRGAVKEGQWKVHSRA